VFYDRNKGGIIHMTMQSLSTPVSPNGTRMFYDCFVIYDVFFDVIHDFLYVFCVARAVSKSRLLASRRIKKQLEISVAKASLMLKPSPRVR